MTRDTPRHGAASRWARPSAIFLRLWVLDAGSLLRSYWQLTKPRVVAMIVFTALVGMLLAPGATPPWRLMLLASTGIWLAAASASAMNHLLDRQFDAAMKRTSRRPLPSGRLSVPAALIFALILGVISMWILVRWVNALTALLTCFSLLGYSLIYTVWLKHLTPQNIVIGGAAGALPAVLGWAAATNGVAPDAWLLFAIVFVWTPPHFWALAIARRDEYAHAGIPMLPVTHGVKYTCTSILTYTAVLTIVTLLPFLTGMSGGMYLCGTLLLNGVFLWNTWQLRKDPSSQVAMKTFRFSIHYLLVLFGLLLLDHFCRVASWFAT